jgi:hypothetical protein
VRDFVGSDKRRSITVVSVSAILNNSFTTKESVVKYIGEIHGSVTGGRHSRNFVYVEFHTVLEGTAYMSNYRSLQCPAFFMLQYTFRLSANRSVPN